MKKFNDAKKDKKLERIISYLVDENFPSENFPSEHLEALFKIIAHFNYSVESEQAIFDFAESLHKDYVFD